MKLTEKGIVLREVKVGESTRLLTLLTQNHGVLSVSAKGSLNPKSKLFSASGLFCYAEWVLREGRTTFFAEEAAPIEVFFGLREDIGRIATASYLAELALVLSPAPNESAPLLRLVLNALYALAQGMQPPELVKPVFEVRALSDSGFLPNLVGCAECAKYDGEPFYFDAAQGELLCADCAGQAGKEPNLSPGALAALRHAALADEDKLFKFTLGARSAAEFSAVAEEFTLYHLDYPPKSLAFLKSMLFDAGAATVETEAEPGPTPEKPGGA